MSVGCRTLPPPRTLARFHTATEFLLGYPLPKLELPGGARRLVLDLDCVGMSVLSNVDMARFGWKGIRLSFVAKLEESTA